MATMTIEDLVLPHLSDEANEAILEAMRKARLEQEEIKKA